MAIFDFAGGAALPAVFECYESFLIMYIGDDVIMIILQERL